MNWVAPPWNYPRGAKDSVPPRYHGGKVFHYVAAMGYDPADRTVWIADSGFWPFGYWCGFDQVADLIGESTHTPPTPRPPLPTRASNRPPSRC